MTADRTKSLNHIEQELIDLVVDESKRWQRIARLMMDVERRELWKMSAPSYTQWVRGVALKADVQPSTLWRCLKAGRFYVEHRDKVRPDGPTLPALAALRPQVSPESLELCEKIGRVVSLEVTDGFVARLVQGEVTRKELRQAWSLYRPATEGQTARGRGKEAPTASTGKPEVGRIVRRADLLRTLQSKAPAWLGTILNEAELPGGLQSLGIADNGLMHGVLVVADDKDLTLLGWQGALVWVDRLWCLVPSRLAKTAGQVIGDMVGILAVGKTVRVHREASEKDTPEDRTGTLAKILLARLVGQRTKTND